MKLLILISLFLSSTVFAGAINRIEKARIAQRNLMYLSEQPGVNGIGIAGCDPRTGEESQNYSRYVYCVSIGAESKLVYQELKKTFPTGTKVNGIFVVIRLVGVITAQPRISVGR